LKDLNIDDEDMLQEIFGEAWQIKLADFMSDVVNDCSTEIKTTMNVKCNFAREFLDEVAIYKSFVKPVLKETDIKDDDLQDYLEMSFAEIENKKSQIAYLVNEIQKTKKGQDELAYNLAKTPFEMKYFENPYPVIEDLWNPPLKQEDSLQLESIKVGAIYEPTGYRKILPPPGKSIRCQKIRVTEIEKNESGTFLSSNNEHLAEMCAIIDDTSKIHETLNSVFQSFIKNFPRFYFSDK
jgi:hypothetical protein